MKTRSVKKLVATFFLILSSFSFNAVMVNAAVENEEPTQDLGVCFTCPLPGGGQWICF